MKEGIKKTALTRSVFFFNEQTTTQKNFTPTWLMCGLVVGLNPLLSALPIGVFFEKVYRRKAGILYQ